MHPELISTLRRERALTARSLEPWLSPDALRWAVCSGRLVRLWRGVYCLPGTESDVVTLLAGLEASTGTTVVACLETAAAVMGFAVDRSADVHVLAGRHGLGSRPGLQVHQRLGAPLARCRGRLVTAPAHTAIELAAQQRRPRAMATLDAVMREQHRTTDQLLAALGVQRGRRGTVKLFELVSLADAAAASPMESETRLALHDGGVAPPVLQHWVRDRAGRPVYRLDLAWPRCRVALEYDGFTHHSSPEDQRNDTERRAWLLDDGWTVMSATVTDVRLRPAQLVRRVAHQLALHDEAGPHQ